MHVVEVDERDASWERDDPIFRLYVFEGPGNAVTAMDVTETDVEGALKVARGATQHDGLLWSLALLEKDQLGDRGLVWLSGTDYNSRPRTVRDWAMRGRMQDRFLRARATRGEEPLLPDGKRVIRMAYEWTRGLPLWEDFVADVGTGLEPGELKIPQGLARGLLAWNDEWVSHDETEVMADHWFEQGIDFFRELQGELQDIAEVRPDFLPQDWGLVIGSSDR